MIRVLVVDDDFMVARIHRRMVERMDGFTVVGEARTGSEALTMTAEHGPDLVLLDIYLPDINGLEVLRRLRGTGTPEVDVLVVTAARDAATVRGALHGGAVHYVIKPFEPETLYRRLARYQEMRTLLDDGTSGQADVDRVFGRAAASGGAVAPARATMPKGLSPESARLVEDGLSRSGDLSASECARVTGLSRVTARRYLEFLTDQGKADVHLRYGTAGRPERRYRWATRPAG